MIHSLDSIGQLNEIFVTIYTLAIQRIGRSVVPVRRRLINNVLQTRVSSWPYLTWSFYIHSADVLQQNTIRMTFCKWIFFIEIVCTYTNVFSIHPDGNTKDPLSRRVANRNKFYLSTSPVRNRPADGQRRVFRSKEITNMWLMSSLIIANI